MKNSFILLALMMLSSYLMVAQNSGKGFGYQAVARDLNGQIIQNQTVTLQFSLFPGQFATESTWQETQSTVTDEFGAFNLVVGHGTRTGGTVNTYAELNFATAAYWLKVELQEGGGFYEISFLELLTAPYAEVAHNAIPNPIGTILPFAGPAAAIPDGYLLCNGASVEKNAYPALYAVIGNSWGSADALHFNLPDCQGTFLRGVANGSANDPDRATRIASNAGGNTGDNVGSKQYDETRKPTSFNIISNGNHRHTWSHGTQGDDSGSGGSYNEFTMIGGSISDVMEYNGTHNHNTDGWDNETRPNNVYVNYIIKY